MNRDKINTGSLKIYIFYTLRSFFCFCHITIANVSHLFPTPSLEHDAATTKLHRGEKGCCVSGTFLFHLIFFQKLTITLQLTTRFLEFVVSKSRSKSNWEFDARHGSSGSQMLSIPSDWRRMNKIFSACESHVSISVNFITTLYSVCVILYSNRIPWSLWLEIDNMWKRWRGLYEFPSFCIKLMKIKTFIMYKY